MRKLSRWLLKRYLWVLVASVLAGLACRRWIAEPYRVPHSRLQSALLPGDVILVWKLGRTQGSGLPSPGEVLLVRADGSDFKVNVFRVRELRATSVVLEQDGGETLTREVSTDAILGKVTRVLYSVAPRHSPSSEAPSWFSRLRFDRFFLKVGV
jgi:hypothetical protein